MSRLTFIALLLLTLSACTCACGNGGGYFDNKGRDDVRDGGIRMIPIVTPKGTFKVWTRRTGNNPRIKVLLLHGGPGGSHDYFAPFDSHFPGQGIEYYYYDQLGSGNSEQPKAPELWTLPRFVEEVEQVRRALHLDKQNFYLYGHSWGGMLAVEYALKYQQHLKALIISNMMASSAAYNAYAKNVLEPQMDPAALAEIKALEAKGGTDDPRYLELLTAQHYTRHFLRMPAADWPEPVNRAFRKLNLEIYSPLQGPSELGVRGLLESWDRTADLRKIAVPTLTIGARYDTMDPEHMKWMANALQHGRFLYCPKGSHLAMYDDQKTYFEGLIRFIRDLDAGTL
jgi:proline iminopeptidase